MTYLPKHSKYFEGILQLRPATKALVSWVRKKTENDGRSSIIRVKKDKHGADLYFSDRRYLVALGKVLRSTFGGMIKTSATLHTQKKGKELYRVTVLFRSFPYRRGQWIDYKGGRWQVWYVANEVTLKEVGGRKMRVKMESLIT